MRKLLSPARGAARLGARASRALKRHGIRGFLRLVFYNVRLLATGRARDHRYVYDSAFDIEHGVDTLGVVEPDEMAVPEPLHRGVERYEAAEPEFFEFLLQRAGPLAPRDRIFIDIGSGKGRVLLMAAMADFRRVVGVELDSRLHDIACRNITIMSRRFPFAEVRSVNQDGITYEFPRRPTVCFINNPFDRGQIERLLDNLEDSLAAHPRDMLLIYIHAFHIDAIRQRGGWREVEYGFFRSVRHPFAILSWRRGSASKVGGGPAKQAGSELT